nr:S24 family peptidase [Erysipelothrix rhusiopathiae]
MAYEEVSKREYDQGDYFLKVVGDSMTGSRIYEGDLIFIKKRKTSSRVISLLF